MHRTADGICFSASLVDSCLMINLSVSGPQPPYEEKTSGVKEHVRFLVGYTAIVLSFL